MASFDRARGHPGARKPDWETAMPKTDRTLASKIRLSNRYSVNITLALNGAGFTCEWEPRFPDRLTKAELHAYREGRDALIAKLALETGKTVFVVET